jgi:hypothetical protein
MSSNFALYRFQVGEVLTLRKAHPCGDNVWIVKRVGQEIGIQCRKCGHFVVMDRRTLEKSVKRIEKPATDRETTRSDP